MIDHSDSDSDEDGGAWCGMFSERKSEDEKFYFHDVVMDGQQVLFKFSYCYEFEFESTFVVGKDMNDDSMPILFAIGMCILPWYWMGYHTAEIVICSEVCTKCSVTSDMLHFWRELYHQVSLEYVYVNKITYKSVIITLEESNGKEKLRSHTQCVTTTPTITATATSKYPVVIPMGGGKDSLVVWYLNKISQDPSLQQQQQQSASLQCDGREDVFSNQPSNTATSLITAPPATAAATTAIPSSTTTPKGPLLVYVADGHKEYQNSWRLQRLVQLTGDDFHLGEKSVYIVVTN